MTIQAAGGWCAPSDDFDWLTLPAFDAAAHRERWPFGGPCSICEGEGSITSGPWCQCPFCEDQIDTDPCSACDGTGIELDRQLVDMPSVPYDQPMVLPVVAITRGGIRWH